MDDEAVDALFDGIDRPRGSLPDLADALMRALAARLPLTRASLRLYGHGTLLLSRIGSALITDWISHEGTPGPAPIAAAGVPLRYADAALGGLDVDPADLADAQLLRAVARQCVFLVRRRDALRWSERRLGRSLLLVGLSKPLRELESFVEICADGRLPVLLQGEFGTEKAQVAAMIHSLGPTAEGPFVEVDCAEPEGRPAQWIERAAGGTLYLGGVDELAAPLQKQLSHYLPPVLHSSRAAGAREARVIASATADLRERTRDGLFSPALLAGLDFLSATIPPLRDRPGDIAPLIWRALEQNGFDAQRKSSDALIAACRGYCWPENLAELERSIARLAVLTGERPIALDDLRRHAPGLVAGPETGADHWADCAIAGDPATLAGLHPALAKALVSLGAHYDRPISLEGLAGQAGVSPSHLSFLFRSVLGLPFKGLLGRIRIRKARELLAADARSSITQVAMSVGFSDLSHFEKSFRRIVGQSPREFRRNVAA